MSVKLNILMEVPSQCDAQREFMRGAEQEFGTSKAIALAYSLVDEEVVTELLPAVIDLLAIMQEQSGNTPSNPMTRVAVAALDDAYEAALTEVADGIVDGVYVLFQLANTLGLPFDELFAAVHTNNMSKLQRDAAGKLRKREDGKLLKPEGYKKVDLRSILFPAPVVAEEAHNE